MHYVPRVPQQCLQHAAIGPPFQQDPPGKHFTALGSIPQQEFCTKMHKIWKSRMSEIIEISSGGIPNSQTIP